MSDIGDMKRGLFVIFITCIIVSIGFGQTQKEPKEYDLKKNVIRWNLSTYLLWGNKSLEFGYERVITPYHTISLNVGYRELPDIIDLNLERFNIDTHKDKSGFSLVFDYRKYFKNRNPKTAPDGLYVGPFLGSYNYYFENHANILDNGIITGDFNVKGQINVINFGAQLGYQFIIKNWVSVDLILIGPGLGFYSGKLTIDNDLTLSEQNEYLNYIKDIIVEKYPGMDNFLKDKTIKSDGFYSIWTAGFRYVIQIGILI